MKKRKSDYVAGFGSLANAIIIQAVKDYRRTSDKYKRKSIENFFRSQWFTMLSAVDPETILEAIQK